MKKVVFLFALLLLAACNSAPIKGFVVAKEYVKGHIDNVQAQRVEEAIIIVPVMHNQRREPEYVKSTFTLFVANRHRVYDIRVDSLTYIKTKVGQRITIKMQ